MEKASFNKTRLLLGAVLCAITLFTAGCSKDSAESPAGTESPDARTALQLTGGISAQTRASDSAWDTGDQIGIYMYAAGTSTIAEDAANIPYVTADGTGAFSPVDESATIYFPVDGSSVDFYAWYPYAETETWTADLTDQSSQAAIDLLTAEAISGTTAYHKDQPQVGLAFQHRLSKLELTIAAGEGISADDLAGTTVVITNQTGSVTYTHASRDLGYVEADPVSISLKITDDGTSAEAIICPNDLAAAASARQLIFTLGSTGEIFYYNIDDAKSFNAGQKNIYSITINRVSIDVTSSVADWTAGNGDGEEGSAE